MFNLNEPKLNLIQKENEFFKTTMDAIDAIVYVSDIETDKLIYINKYGKSILGDKVGQKCSTILDIEQNAPCNICKTIINNDNHNDLKEKHFVWEFKNNFSGKWFQCRVKIIEWETGQYVRVGIATEITKRKQAELALKESEKKYRLIFEKQDYKLIILVLDI